MTLLVFNINVETSQEKETLESSVNWDETLINDLRILDEILFGPIVFKELSNKALLFFRVGLQTLNHILPW